MSNPTKHEIAAARFDANLTQGQAAKLIHISERMWQYYESGEHPMPPDRWELFNLKRTNHSQKNEPTAP